MNRTVQSIGLGLMTVSMAGVALAVSPQLLTVQAPTTDAAVPATQVVSVAPASGDLIDAYKWRQTVSPPTTPPPPPNKQGL